MTHPKLIVLVRFKSALSLDEVMKIANERADDFRALAGLQQKYYVHDPVSEEIGGLYLWDSPEAFDDYRRSDLRASIAKTYQAEGEPRVEVLSVLMPLRQGGG